MKSQVLIKQNSFFLSIVKKSNFNKAAGWVRFQVYRDWHTNPLIRG